VAGFATAPGAGVQIVGEQASWPCTELAHEAERLTQSMLRLEKRPVSSRWRPRQVPAWDHEVRRVARVWSIGTWPDELLLRHLRDNTVSDTMIETPTPEHHLWRAAEAVRSMREALDGLD
jgi:hypothetical protein